MKYAIGILFCFFCLDTMGQHRLSAKIYHNTDAFRVYYKPIYPFAQATSNRLNFNRFSLALNIQSRHGHTHEIEFFMPEISKPESRVQFPTDYNLEHRPELETRITSYAMRYEVNQNLTSGLNFRFNLGVGINPYYLLIRNNPKEDNWFYSSNRIYGAALNLIPRFKYRMNNHFTLEANIPLNIIDYRIDRSYFANPSIPLAQQTTDKYYFRFFEKAFTFRIGLRYNFSSKAKQVKNKRTGLFDSDSFF